MARREKIELFLEKISISKSGCWLWTGCLSKGYGLFRHEKSVQSTAHRFSYKYFKGTIPKNLQIDHLCKVRSCVNPEHLEAVTAKENLDRARHWSTLNREKDACPKGHKYTSENTYITSTGGRSCKRCNRERMRILRADKIKSYTRKLKRSCGKCGKLLRKFAKCC